jgi:hypothetical protein
MADLVIALGSGIRGWLVTGFHMEFTWRDERGRKEYASAIFMITC